ncbi:MAG: CPBP family intramembrane metalloprotease [Ruminiclostridium sp.]|nr:CPBP family intramembrane metalloprotease [Ruminiclostridium sp.]
MAITSEFRAACKKTGLALLILFVFRLVAEGANYLVSLLLKEFDPTGRYIISTLVSIIFLYICPIVLTMKVFGYKKSDNRIYYKKCNRLAKAVSWVLPCYGLGQIINLTVLVISFLLANNKQAVEDTFAPITSGETVTTTVTVVALLIQFVIIAPLFEEFWFRGIIQTGLAPYGNGFAIMVSALLFGLAHGNVHQFCFTFVVGIVLGYVRYASDSLIPTTIIHAILNSVAAIILAFTTSEPIISGIVKTQKGEELNSLENAMFILLCVFLVIVFVFMIAGMVNAISKLKKNRLYRPVNNYPEMTKGEKLTALLKEPVFLISLILSTLLMIAVIFI